MLPLVSSAAIRSASFSTRIARKVISSRFPIGVATRYNIPQSAIQFPDLLCINSFSLIDDQRAFHMDIRLSAL